MMSKHMQQPCYGIWHMLQAILLSVTLLAELHHLRF